MFLLNFYRTERAIVAKIKRQLFCKQKKRKTFVISSFAKKDNSFPLIENVTGEQNSEEYCRTPMIVCDWVVRSLVVVSKMCVVMVVNWKKVKHTHHLEMQVFIQHTKRTQTHIKMRHTIRHSRSRQLLFLLLLCEHTQQLQYTHTYIWANGHINMDIYEIPTHRVVPHTTLNVYTKEMFVRLLECFVWILQLVIGVQSVQPSKSSNRNRPIGFYVNFFK